MYTFTDRGGDIITLRPEATAGVCRALVTNGLTQSLPQKVFYAGPMFRYERPQKGRYRQFHQIDIELIGSAEPLADAEVIACGWDILTGAGRRRRDGAGDQHARRQGEPRRLPRRAGGLLHRSTRRRCREDSLARLDRNPLRILDSKDEGDRRIVANAPVIAGHLTEAAAAFYAGVQRTCGRFGVPFRENPRIVRGLDYYGHTAFEFVTSKLGAQGTVMGGGRYDGLVEEMGGPPTPGGRLGGRYRAPGHAAGRRRRRPRRRSRWCRWARRRKPRRSTCCRPCAAPGSAPRWRIAATCAGAWSAPTASAPAPR